MGIFTKLNTTLLAPGIACVFVVEWIKNRKETGRYLLQFVSFLAVCAPLGLYFPLRNLNQFGVPPGYIQKMAPDSALRIWEVPAWQRILVPQTGELTHAFPSLDAEKETNVWLQAIRTSLFDEYLPAQENRILLLCAQAAFWCAILVSVLLCAALLWSACRENFLPFSVRLFLLVCFAAILGGYEKFCMDEPFVCTMSFRYIAGFLIFLAVGGGLWLDGETNGNPVKRTGMKFMLRAIQGSGIIFLVLELLLLTSFCMLDFQ